MRRGEVWWVNFGPSVGGEIRKQRPAVIVSNDAANATATFRIEPAATGSKVLIHTDLTLSGAVAQYGRGVGMIQATAAQLVGQFADNLRTQLVQERSVTRHDAPPAPPAAKPISGLWLFIRVIWSRVGALFGGRRI